MFNPTNIHLARALYYAAQHEVDEESTVVISQDIEDACYNGRMYAINYINKAAVPAITKLFTYLGFKVTAIEEGDPDYYLINEKYKLVKISGWAPIEGDSNG